MTASISQRARQLHASSAVIIGHDHICAEDNLLSLQPAGLAAKICLVSLDARAFSDPADREKSLHEYTGFTNPALVELERVRRVVERNPDALCLALTAADIEQAHSQGRSAVVLGFEGGKPIEQSLELLHVFHRLGLRMMQLTWAGGNDICDRRDPPACAGLTPFGREVVREMNQLGMLIDPGHCRRETFFQVLELSSQPVSVLHATPRGAKPGAGDLDDEQIEALAQSGGVVGLHFFSHYLNPERKATVDDLVDHVGYLAELAGIDHIALGADYFIMNDDFRQAHGMPPGGFLGIPEEFDSYGKLVNVTQALCARGYRDEDIRKILGGNLLRVFRAVFGE